MRGHETAEQNLTDTPGAEPDLRIVCFVSTAHPNSAKAALCAGGRTGGVSFGSQTVHGMCLCPDWMFTVSWYSTFFSLCIIHYLYSYTVVAVWEYFALTVGFHLTITCCVTIWKLFAFVFLLGSRETYLGSALSPSVLNFKSELTLTLNCHTQPEGQLDIYALCHNYFSKWLLSHF